MLNYRQLFYFWQVVRHGGISRAAEQLNLTPQTISGQVAELERHFQTSLFQRRGRRLELTEAGKLAHERAEEIFQIGSELEARLRGDATGDRPLLRVGISNVIPKSIAWRLLAPACHLDEPVRLVCHEDRLEQLFASLAVHQIDLVIADRPLPSELGVKGFSHLLCTSDTAFYANATLTKRFGQGFPHSLDQAPLLMPGQDSAHRPLLERWFSQHDIHPAVVGEFDDTALMKTFGEQGIGVFPAPAIIADEAQRQHGVTVIGCTEDIVIRYYAISAERQLRHPAIAAISQGLDDSVGG